MSPQLFGRCSFQCVPPQAATPQHSATSPRSLQKQRLAPRARLQMSCLAVSPSQERIFRGGGVCVYCHLSHHQMSLWMDRMQVLSQPHCSRTISSGSSLPWLCSEGDRLAVLVHRPPRGWPLTWQPQSLLWFSHHGGLVNLQGQWPSLNFSLSGSLLYR